LAEVFQKVRRTLIRNPQSILRSIAANQSLISPGFRRLTVSSESTEN